MLKKVRLKKNISHVYKCLSEQISSFRRKIVQSLRPQFFNFFSCIVPVVFKDQVNKIYIIVGLKHVNNSRVLQITMNNYKYLLKHIFFANFDFLI